MESAKAITVGNKVYRPFLDNTLTADDLRVAKEELNETQETKETCLRLLKEMVREQNEFTSRLDDEFLLRFLRCRKFDSKKAFKMLREHYRFRKMNPGIFMSPTAIEEALRRCIFNFLPHRDHKGRVVFLIRFDRWDADKIPYFDFVAAGNLVAEYASINNSLTQIHGYLGIWDYAGFNFKHFRQICSPQNGLMLANLMQDRFPGRFKLAYCINCHPLVKTAWNLLRPFMKEKFRHRIQIVSSMEELHEYFDPSILPKEYGGTLPNSLTKEIVKRVLDKEQYFKLNSKFGF
ncbi:unnamed protein product [Larinioides sclopetarius]|uniref:CRAL-TRIO domain-containing protein n=1 Tax=Larinioides sclopetarius TaxID=280406 RepID=A0AAV1ZXN1_9ARAC